MSSSWSLAGASINNRLMEVNNQLVLVGDDSFFLSCRENHHKTTKSSGNVHIRDGTSRRTGDKPLCHNLHRWSLTLTVYSSCHHQSFMKTLSMHFIDSIYLMDSFNKTNRSQKHSVSLVSDLLSRNGSLPPACHPVLPTPLENVQRGKRNCHCVEHQQKRKH